MKKKNSDVIVLKSGENTLRWIEVEDPKKTNKIVEILGSQVICIKNKLSSNLRLAS
jgi:hypothetical protein